MADGRAGETGATADGARARASARAFGRAMLAAWGLDPEVAYLNHGTVGAPPGRVLEAQQRIRDEIERQPSRFLLRDLAGVGVGVPRHDRSLLRGAAREVAAFVGAREADLALVDNATTAANAVFQSWGWRDGDELLATDHAYGGVLRAALHATRRRGAHVRVVELPYPVSDPAAVVAAIDRAIGPRTRVVLVDHITSLSALVLPVAEIAERCRRRGVAVLVDGAHAPGAIALDIPSLGVDWYGANLHKWAFSPRPAGFLWAAPSRQESLHPPVISWGLDQGFTLEFDWMSTRDPSALLAAPEGIAFLRDLGPEAVQGHNRDLALDAARFLTARWGTGFGSPESMIGTMVTVPLPERFGRTPEDATRLRDALLFEHRVEVQLHEWRGRLWVRVSAQVYNDWSDVERLARGVES